jgi:hypothetical protein
VAGRLACYRVVQDTGIRRTGGHGPWHGVL